VISKAGKRRHLKEAPGGRKVVNHMNTSTKEAAHKWRKMSCPTGLLTRPVFPHG